MANNYLLVFLCGLVVQCYGQNSYYFENHKYCDDLSPYYGDINLDQIAGVWYGVEKIPHMKGEYRIEHTRHDCFYIDIKEQYIQVGEFMYRLLYYIYIIHCIRLKHNNFICHYIYLSKTT